MITQDVSFPSENKSLKAYYARPDGDGPFPGILVIHEAFGLNQNMKDIAHHFVEQGYAALAVDLFGSRSRVLCMFSIFLGMQRNSLNHSAIRDLKNSLTFLSQQMDVDPNRLGAVGYCLGGSLAIALACTDHRLKAIAPYYAMNPQPFEAIKNLCPVVGSYPAQDFTAAGGQKLDNALDAYHIPHDIKIYPDAKHSFFNDQGSSYYAQAANDSWERVLAYFREYV
jgi:carboxymethylenebutenolidase